MPKSGLVDIRTKAKQLAACSNLQVVSVKHPKKRGVLSECSYSPVSNKILCIVVCIKYFMHNKENLCLLGVKQFAAEESLCFNLIMSFDAKTR